MQAGELLSFHLLFFFLKRFPVEGLFVFEQVPEHAGQVDSLAVARSALRVCTSGAFLSRVVRSSVRHGGDGFGAAQAGLPAAIDIAKVVLGAGEALGGHPQRGGDSAFHEKGSVLNGA